ncbi:hypothetical protein [Croceibacter atlanticus]|uniref:hypothetical protein n=1 Tax=Croceibacter atlanticus TaxID=313588 RepID=UPI002E14A7F9|nr:hypothetical protein VVL01_11140 [Croceibacter atlanticus]
MTIKFYRVRREMTHENEYFRSLAHQLNAYHLEKDTQDLHEHIANISVNAHKLDALYISHGPITVIDFKDVVRSFLYFINPLHYFAFGLMEGEVDEFLFIKC